MNRYLTEEQQKIAINMSTINTRKEIADFLGFNPSSISKFFKKNNIQGVYKSKFGKCKTELDVNFFEHINTPQKAYWLGYVCADGHVYKNKQGTTCGINLVSKDKEIIEKFKTDIKSDYKITLVNHLHKHILEPYYYTHISNFYFAQHLINLGITNQKSDILVMPKIEEKFYSYFFAGLFDGDGCICFHKGRNRLLVNLVSTKEILHFLCDYLNQKLDLKIHKIYKVKCKKNNVFKFYIYSEKNVMKFLHFIYQDSTFQYMSRKYDLYKQKIKQETI